jgi:lysophospholipase L1-like esterase
MTLKIVFCGDSTVAGYTIRDGAYIRSPNRISAVLQDLFDQRFGVNEVICDNQGQGGSTSPQWLWGLPPVTIPWAQRMQESDAHLFVMCTGINDAYEPNIRTQDYRYCYQEFHRLARSAGKRVVFTTPNPINTAHNPRLWELQHNMKDVAASLTVPVIDAYGAVLAAAPAWKSMLPDAVHPSDELYRFQAHVALLVLEPIAIALMRAAQTPGLPNG